MLTLSQELMQHAQQRANTVLLTAHAMPVHVIAFGPHCERKDVRKRSRQPVQRASAAMERAGTAAAPLGQYHAAAQADASLQHAAAV